MRAVQPTLLALVPQLHALRVPDLPIFGRGLLKGEEKGKEGKRREEA